VDRCSFMARQRIALSGRPVLGRQQLLGGLPEANPAAQRVAARAGAWMASTKRRPGNRGLLSALALRRRHDEWAAQCHVFGD
jgi:hypothetical protein